MDKDAALAAAAAAVCDAIYRPLAAVATPVASAAASRALDTADSA